jgi:hypothetical protein
MGNFVPGVIILTLWTPALKYWRKYFGAGERRRCAYCETLEHHPTLIAALATDIEHGEITNETILRLPQRNAHKTPHYSPLRQKQTKLLRETFFGKFHEFYYRSGLFWIGRSDCHGIAFR